MSVKVELVNIRTTLELRGGRVSRVPAKIRSTVASSLGMFDNQETILPGVDARLYCQPSSCWCPVGSEEITRNAFQIKSEDEFLVDNLFLLLVGKEADIGSLVGVWPAQYAASLYLD